ncbi:MAG: hypothetical protein AB1758_22680 [Candidatus Eremiobacterota bacterium]
MDRHSAAEASDVYSPSEAAQKLPSTKQEKFLTTVMAQLEQMDEQSETFVDDATQKLVDSALEQEFGEEIQHKPGYPQMQHKITRTILSDPHYREIVEDFLYCVLEHKGRQGDGSQGQEREEEEEDGEDEEEGVETSSGAPPRKPPGARETTSPAEE